ncbi:MAG: hypothetical protein AAF511_03575 [Pseudomonadota bacterium]
MHNLFALAAAAMISLSAARAATIVVDIDSQPIDNGVTVSLDAGTYEISFIDGVFKSWNPWGSVAGCDSDGTGCNRGWLTNLDIEIDGTIHRFGRHGKFATADLALANASPFQLDLAALTDVTFSIFDTNYGGNIGGLSFQITSVPTPVPGAALLFVAGAAVFASGRRRRVAG